VTPDQNPVNDNTPIDYIRREIHYRPPGYGPPTPDGVDSQERWMEYFIHEGSAGPANKFILPKPKSIGDVYRQN
jgi:hypothetical protein